jgi:Ger(x)C family germination protein
MILTNAGCGGGRDTDEISYTVAIGIDKAPDKRLAITFQFAVPANFVGGAEKGSKYEPGVLNTITAANLAEARNLLQSTMSRVPNYTHTKVIIIGEELARQGLGDILSPIMRFREFRGTMYIAIVPGTAQEFMEGNQPKLGTTPSKYETFITKDVESGYFLRSDFQEFYARLKNNMGSPYAMMVNINPKTMEIHPAKQKGPNEKVDDLKAGEIPRSGTENPAEIHGMALFRGDKMVGSMSGLDTRAMAMVSGQFKRSFLVLQDPLEPTQTVNINIHQGRKPKVEAEFVDGKPMIHISLLIEGEITSIESGINYEMEEYRIMLEEQGAQLLTQQIYDFIRTTQGLQCDPAGLGANFRPKMKNWDEVEYIDVVDLYSRAEISVEVIMKVRRTSLMWRTSPILNSEGG